MMALKTTVDLHGCRVSHKTKDLEETELSSNHTDSLFQHSEAVLPSFSRYYQHNTVSTQKALTETN